MKPGTTRRIAASRCHAWIVLVWVVAATSGCANEAGQPQAAIADPTQRFEFYGFSIFPPRSGSWTVDTSIAQRGVPVVFTRQGDSATAGAGEAHTIVAMATAKYIDLPYHNQKELLRQLRKYMQDEWSGEARYEMASFQALPDKSLGSDCLKYAVTVRDRGVPGFTGSIFTFSGRGFRCVHPYHPGLVIDIGYSQRYRQGDWITAVDAEVQPFLESLAFTPVQLSPYVATRLDEYAALLRDLTRTSEAIRIEAHAEKLRELVRSEESSTYLGFQPDAVLKEYAAVLRANGREAEAQEMEALAEKYQLNNFAAFQKLMRK